MAVSEPKKLPEVEIDYLRYKAGKRSPAGFPHRRAYVGLSESSAELLAHELGVPFVSKNRPLCPARAGGSAVPRAVVVYFNKGWKAGDPSAWQSVHRLVETPPCCGGPSLVVEVYPDRDAFLSECPSRHHVGPVMFLDQGGACCGGRSDDFARKEG